MPPSEPVKRDPITPTASWVNAPSGSLPGDSPASPPRLGQYEILTELGRGGMGVVYQARHVRLQKVVALKVLSKERVSDADALARFGREMEAIGQLDHPHIVQAHDAGEVDGIHFLVMQYYDGLDLARVARQRGPLPAAEACEAMRQAALGLQHVHEHGLVHRDIKPSNLLLTTAGQVKLLDLGLARLQAGESGEAALTASGRVVGTVDFMAPEQAFDHRRSDIRADLYSLGCTLYYLLAGRPPFCGEAYDTTLKKLLAHAQETPPPIEEQCPAISAELAMVVSRLLSKGPGQRYALPQDLADALAPLAKGADLRALAAAARAALPRTSAGASPTLGETLAGKPLISTPQATSRDSLERSARLALATLAPPRRRRPTWRVAVILLGVALLGALGWYAAGGFPFLIGEPGEPIAPRLARVEDLQPLKPHDLPVGQPEVAASAASLDNSRWSFDETRREIHIDSNDLIALSLAEAESGSFTFHVDISQTNWLGDAGVFFGFHERSGPNGELEWLCQMISLRRHDSGEGPPVFRLGRDLVVLRRTKSQYRTAIRITVDYVDVPLSPLDTLGHRLTIRVADGVLEAVFWNAKTIPELTTHEAERQAAEHARGGRLGIFNIRSSTTFHRPQIVRHAP